MLPSSTREKPIQFITTINSFQLALKYTWEISDISLAFLTSKFQLRAQKSEAKCQLFINVAILVLLFKRATIMPNKLINSQHYQWLRRKTVIAFHSLTVRPHNHAVKSIILKNFKLRQNNSETGTIFSQPSLISFKHDKKIGNFLVRNSFQTTDQSGTFICAHSWCKTCPFIEKMSGFKRSIKITYHFTCTSANVIYCITCTYCNKLYIGETGRWLGEWFPEHLHDVERDVKDASKPIVRHLNLPNHSTQHMAVCSLSLHLGNSELQTTGTNIYCPKRHS